MVLSSALAFKLNMHLRRACLAVNGGPLHSPADTAGSRVAVAALDSEGSPPVGASSMLNANAEENTIQQELLDALLLAIRALNRPRNFDTGIPNPANEARTLRSYDLLPLLEAVARRAGGQP